MRDLAELFTPRQLTALTTFCDLLGEVADYVVTDAVAAGMDDDGVRLRDGGRGAQAYADAVVTYLAFAIDKCTNLWSNIVTWMNDRGAFREVFARQAIPMTWDFAEASLAGIETAGIGEARAGKFRLYERGELDPEWSPLHDERLTVWEATQHLAAAPERSESEAAELLHALGGYGDRARQLAYLLYQKANDQGWASEAGAYNSLIAVWPSLRTGAASVAAAASAPSQGNLPV